jgi:hypothetical protein
MIGLIYTRGKKIENIVIESKFIYYKNLLIKI